MAWFFRERWNKEGPGVPAPSGGIAGYLYQIGIFFWKFAKMNILFLLASLPLITLPVALTALNRVCIVLIRDRNVLAWEEFRDEFKASFRKGLLLGLIVAVWVFASYYLLSLGISNWDNPFGMVFMAVGAIVGAFALVWAAYAFVLLAALELPLRDIMGNARALMFLDRKWTLAVFALLLSVGILIWLFPLVTGIVLAVVGITLIQYTLCCFINEPLEKWIIGPYERSLKEGDAEV